MNREEVAWAAGIFEGEGCIVYHEAGGAARYSRPYPSLRVALNGDRDVVERLHRALGGSLHVAKRLYGHEQKPRVTWSVSGFEATQAAIAMLWPWLGERRRARAAEVLRICR